MSPELKQICMGLLQGAWQLLKQIVGWLWDITVRAVHRCCFLIEEFCSARKEIAQLKDCAEVARLCAEHSRIQLESTAEHLRIQLKSTDSQLDFYKQKYESVSEDIDWIMNMLERQKDSLRDRLKNNLMNMDKPQGVIVNETIDDWWKNFLQLWEKK